MPRKNRPARACEFRAVVGEAYTPGSQSHNRMYLPACDWFDISGSGTLQRQFAAREPEPYSVPGAADKLHAGG
jgi:hypothetical protein